MGRQIAVSFDRNRLGRGPAVYNAYALLFQTLDIEKMKDCKLFHGKDASGYTCVCFEPGDENTLTYISDTIGKSEAEGLVEPDRRTQIAKGISDENFMVFAGAIDEEGILRGSGKMAMHFPLIAQKTTWRDRVTDEPIMEEEDPESVPEVAVELLDVAEIPVTPVEDAPSEVALKTGLDEESVPYVEVEALPVEDDFEPAEIAVEPVPQYNEHPSLPTSSPHVSAPRPVEIMKQPTATIMEFGRVIPISDVEREDPLKFAVKIGWAGYKKHPFRLLLMMFFAFLVASVPAVIFALTKMQDTSLAGFWQGFSTDSDSLASFIVKDIFAGLLYFVLHGGILRVTLQDMRGRETRFSQMFSGLRRFVGASLTILPIVLLNCGFNSTFLQSPTSQALENGTNHMILLATVGLGFTFFLFLLGDLLLLLILDRGYFGVPAYQYLIGITKKHLLSVVLLFLLQVALFALGALLFGVGLLVTGPLSVAIVCAFYERLQIEYFGRNY